MSFSLLREMVKKALPAEIYRCIGVIFTAESPERRAILQVVGRRSDLIMLDDWDGREPKTQIVAIGAAGVMDPSDLEAKFNSCIVTSAH